MGGGGTEGTTGRTIDLPKVEWHCVGLSGLDSVNSQLRTDSSLEGVITM